jgi:hypothetical protein
MQKQEFWAAVELMVPKKEYYNCGRLLEIGVS